MTYYIILLLTMATAAGAGDVAIPNTFESNTPAMAAEVNENFTAMETALNDNDRRIAAIEAALDTLRTTITAQSETIADHAGTIAHNTNAISVLQGRMVAVETSEVMALDDYLLVDETGDPRGPLVRLSGVNLQIVNGLESTHTINGLGNLIIGYDETNTTSAPRCSHSDYTDQAGCERAGETWSNSHKTGSHYIVTGSENSYSSYGGIVAGLRNSATGRHSTVTGGIDNVASGYMTSVSGGWANSAQGYYSSISGGAVNIARGNYSSISGGMANKANGLYSSVSGGMSNTADGEYSSVSGGRDRTAAGELDWVAGSLMEDL
ncbi:MAG: hypothetical protein HKM93_00790 [Desulfobacteraceae bacterium]|nr:hypothetical protein [Desulfobacteraceae bacterium]